MKYRNHLLYAIVISLALLAAPCLGVIASESGSNDRSGQGADTTPVVRGIEINPSNPSVPVGGSLKFKAAVWGDNISDSGVKWSVEGENSGDTQIDKDGTLWVSAKETSQSIVVKAASLADKNRSASVKVSITKGTFNVTAVSENDAFGTVTGGGEASIGSDAVILAKAKPGYSFLRWELDGQLYSKNESVRITNVNRDMRFVAYFERDTFMVKASVSPANGGTVSGTGEYRKGMSATLTATPSSEYKFNSWKQDGNIIGAEETLILEKISADQSVIAVFEKKPVIFKLPEDKEQAQSAGTGQQPNVDSAGHSASGTFQTQESQAVPGGQDVSGQSQVLTPYNGNDGTETYNSGQSMPDKSTASQTRPAGSSADKGSSAASNRVEQTQKRDIMGNEDEKYDKNRGLIIFALAGVAALSLVVIAAGVVMALMNR